MPLSNKAENIHFCCGCHFPKKRNLSQVRLLTPDMITKSAMDRSFGTVSINSTASIVKKNAKCRRFWLQNEDGFYFLV